MAAPLKGLWGKKGVKLCSPHLLLEQQDHAVAHLVAVDGGERHVEEEAVEDRLGDPLQRQRQQEDRRADENVGGQRRHTRLLHLHDTERKRNHALGRVRGKRPKSKNSVTK